MRESLFNLLAHGGYGDPVPAARVLDLFAGTGALGLEALSRGAAAAAFVDNGRPALALLRANIGKLGAETARDGDRARRDEAGGRIPAKRSTWRFLDPPYGRALGERAVAAAMEGGWLAPGALVVWEEGAAIAPNPGLTLLDARRYGNAMISILRLSAS